jgi:hypothetical protein
MRSHVVAPQPSLSFVSAHPVRTATVPQPARTVPSNRVAYGVSSNTSGDGHDAVDA